MMRRIPISCGVALLSLLPVAAHAQRLQNAAAVKVIRPPKPPKAVHLKPKQTISSMEQQWRTATLTGDTTQMDKLLADDYVGISWNGQVNTKTSQLNRLRSKDISLTQLDLTDLKVKMVGSSVAIVTSQAAMSGVIDGSEVHGNFRYTRVYQEDPNGTWKVTNFEATRIPKHGKNGTDGVFPVAAPPASAAPELKPAPASADPAAPTANL